MAAAELPAAIGRFRVEAEIGRGAMGIVYKAHDPLMDRPVAVKVVHLAFAVSDAQRAEFDRRFLSEARIVARLSHPGIVVAYDVGRMGEDGPPYVAFEYLTGRTLAQTLAEGRPDWREALRLVARLGRALHYAHAQGVVHRDLKPANVMVLPNGEPKLMDFGLARLASAVETSATGTLVGTPLYMSPEQALGAAVDARSDLFSLGSLAYTLITGRRAFEAEQVPQIVHRVIHDDPPPPTRLDRVLPSAVDYLVQRALAKPREARYPDGDTLADDFEDVSNLRPPRHRGAWVPPANVGEETVTSPQRAPRRGGRAAAVAEDDLPLRGAALEGVGAAFELSAPAVPAEARDAVGEREWSRADAGPVPEPSERRARSASGSLAAHLSLALLVASMLVFGATLVLSSFWRQQLAEWLGVGARRAAAVLSPSAGGPASTSPVPSPGLAGDAAASSSSVPAPDISGSAASAAMPGTEVSPTDPVDAGPDARSIPADPAAASSGTLEEAESEAESEPADKAADGAPARTAGEPDTEPAPAASGATAGAAAAGAARASPSPPPTKRATPRATARLRISVSHDLKSARLKVRIDGRAVADVTLRAQKKRHLVFFERREGKAETRLPVVPGRRRITVEVQAGSRRHAEDLRETFVAGRTRQLNLRVSGRDGLAFDWE